VMPYEDERSAVSPIRQVTDETNRGSAARVQRPTRRPGECRDRRRPGKATA
jgi:hypothetical protein